MGGGSSRRNRASVLSMPRQSIAKLVDRAAVGILYTTGREEEKRRRKVWLTAFHLAPDKKGSQAGKWAGVQARPTHGAQ